MSDATSADLQVPAGDQESAAHMLAVADLTTRMYDTKGVLDVTVTAHKLRQQVREGHRRRRWVRPAESTGILPAPGQPRSLPRSPAARHDSS